MTITVVMPTIARPSLHRALASLVAQEWVTGDELLLIGDGYNLAVRNTLKEFGLPGRYIELGKQLGFWGHAARNFVLDHRLVKTDLIYSLDDDDTLEPDALASIRQAAIANPGRPLMFQISFPCVELEFGSISWDREEVALANVGTGMFCFLNDGRWGRYGLTHEGDFDMIRDTIALQGNPIWVPKVIYNVLGFAA